MFKQLYPANTLLIIVITLMGCLLFSPKSTALGKEGHRIVCQLAYDLLPKNKQLAVDQLLTILPEKHKQRINKYNYRAKNSEIDFAVSCTWADAIKKDPEYDRFKSWHYMNIERNIRQMHKNPCEKDCVLTAIKKHSIELTKATDKWQQAKALMFLGHWVGDIHQPLHVSYASDLGGNKTKIKPTKSAKCKSLHWYWDQCIINYNNENFSSLMKKLTKQLPNENTQKWQTTPPLKWANESLAILRQPSFNYCKLNQQGECREISTNARELPADYGLQYHQVMQTRLMQAALRLKQQLVDAL